MTTWPADRLEVAGDREHDRQHRGAERHAGGLARGPHAAEGARAALAVRSSVVRDHVGQHRHRQRLHARVGGTGERDGDVDPRPGHPDQQRSATSAATPNRTDAITKARSLPMRRETIAPERREEQRGGDERDEQDT